MPFVYTNSGTNNDGVDEGTGLSYGSLLGKRLDQLYSNFETKEDLRH
jgi:hypothetical protein